MRRLIATVALLFAWLCANGAIWDAMQVAAWGKMFAGYSGTMPIVQALQETLDPSKPCDMCVGIAQARDAGEKQLPLQEQTASAKFVLVFQAVEQPVFANEPGEWVTAPANRVIARTDPVPLQPPRV